MTYELWAGHLCLGRSNLEFPQLSRITFGGEFQANPEHVDAVERMALRIDCISAWMNRETRNSAGEHVVTSHYRNSRLFTTIADIITRQFDPSLQLRTADGTVISTRHLVIRDNEPPTLFPELVAEAISAGDANAQPDADDVPPPFNGAPEGRELYGMLQTEAEEEARENAWRGDLQEDDVNDDAWKVEFDAIERAPRERFQLHVMLEHKGDIPADISWLE